MKNKKIFLTFNPKNDGNWTEKYFKFKAQCYFEEKLEVFLNELGIIYQ